MVAVEGDVVATARTVSVHLDDDGRPERVPGTRRERAASYDDSTGPEPSEL